MVVVVKVVLVLVQLSGSQFSQVEIPGVVYRCSTKTTVLTVIKPSVGVSPIVSVIVV